MKGLFITGTDTDVGKTWVTARLAQALRARGIDAGVWKPVQAGCMWGEPDADSHVLKTVSGVEDTEAEICPISLRAPLAPLVAAAAEDRTLSVDEMISPGDLLSARHDVLLVEGAGGLAVPVSTGELIVHLAVKLGFPVLIIARPGLGTINHTLLSINYAQQYGLNVIGVILNRYNEVPARLTTLTGPNTKETLSNSLSTNPLCIELFSQVPVLGRVPDAAEVGTTDGIENHIEVDRIIHELNV